MSRAVAERAVASLWHLGSGTWITAHQTRDPEQGLGWLRSGGGHVLVLRDPARFGTVVGGSVHAWPVRQGVVVEGPCARCGRAWGAEGVCLTGDWDVWAADGYPRVLAVRDLRVEEPQRVSLGGPWLGELWRGYDSRTRVEYVEGRIGRPSGLVLEGTWTEQGRVSGPDPVAELRRWTVQHQLGLVG